MGALEQLHSTSVFQLGRFSLAFIYMCLCCFIAILLSLYTVWTAYICFLTLIWADFVSKIFLHIKRDNETLSIMGLVWVKSLHLFISVISDFVFCDKKWAKPWHLCLYLVPNAVCCNSFSAFFFFSPRCGWHPLLFVISAALAPRGLMALWKIAWESKVKGQYK